MDCITKRLTKSRQIKLYIIILKIGGANNEA